MKLFKLLVFIVGSIMLVPAMAQLPSTDQETMRGRLYGLGQGLAAAIVIGAHPVHVEQLEGNAAADSLVERQYFSEKGLQVVALRFAKVDFLTPASVDVAFPDALRLIDHDFPEMNRAAIVSNFGPPIFQTGSLMHYKGLAQICSDSMDIGLKDEKIASIKWTFCTD